MQTYRLTLQSEIFNTFRCQKAANSLDIDVEKKSIHEFQVKADLDTPYNLGLIVGASGSGKTTLAQHIFGADRFRTLLQPDLPVIEQFPAAFTYEDCAGMLSGVGLTSVPCWIRPAFTLSNGQRARAECALQLAHHADDVTVIDEWTSVVDRTVAKAMSHCLQKHVRKTNRRMVLLSCHYDVIDWLNPDWVIDANRQEYVDRRLLWRSHKRAEQLTFDVRPVDRGTWRFFSKYHYLSDRLPGGLIRTFGLFHENEQIGFQCFANYVPHRKGSTDRIQMHSNRTVIHPDYCGLGLGILLINAVSERLHQEGYDVRAKSSSRPIYLSRIKYPGLWQLLSTQLDTPNPGGNMIRKGGFRKKVLTYSFRYLGQQRSALQLQ